MARIDTNPISIQSTRLLPVFDNLKTNFILIRAIRVIRGKPIAVFLSRPMHQNGFAQVDNFCVGTWRRSILGLE